MRYEDTGVEIGKRVRERYSWTADDFTSVRGDTEWTMTFARGDWRTRVETRRVMTCTPTEFRVHARLDAVDGAVRVRSRDWGVTLARETWSRGT